MWREMTDEQKQPYLVLAEQDKQRFQTEVIQAKNHGSSRMKIKRKPKIGPNGEIIKRRANPYILWKSDRIRELQAKMGASFNFHDAVQTITGEWNKMSEEQKKAIKDGQSVDYQSNDVTMASTFNQEHWVLLRDTLKVFVKYLTLILTF